MDLFGGAKNTTKSKKTKKTSDSKKKTTKTTKTTKSAKTSDAKKTKKSSTTTRSKSKAKGGNFLGTVGDLVAPTGWGPFATAAGLLALDRADAALRRGTKEKKEKMKGGECKTIAPHNSLINTPAVDKIPGNLKLLYGNNFRNNRAFIESIENPQINIICEKNGNYNLQLWGSCTSSTRNGDDTFIYTNTDDKYKNKNFEELKEFIKIRKNQFLFIRDCLKSEDFKKICKKPNS